MMQQLFSNVVDSFRIRDTRYHFKNLNYIIVCVVVVPTAYFIFHNNVLTYIRTKPFAHFEYPLQVDLEEVVARVLNREPVHVGAVNIVKYPYIINNDRKCKTPDGEDESVYLLFLIKSKVEHFEQRRMIRKTWAREFLMPYVKIRRMFLLGTRFADRNMQHRIGLEAQEYDDILQQYFDDAYYNNTLKFMMGCQWVVNYCRTASYIGFVDDDYYVNTYSLLKILHAVKPTDIHNILIGYIWENIVPSRIYNSVGYISLEEYPYGLYPPYPTAGSFFLPFETLERMSVAIPYVKYLRFDDVFVGILAWKLKIQLRHNKNLHSDVIPFHDREQFKDVVAAHGFSDVELLYKVWNEMDQYRNKQNELHQKVH